MGLKCQLVINMDTHKIFTNWSKLHKNMLNSNGPTMEPCGTLKTISDHELHVPFNSCIYTEPLFSCKTIKSSEQFGRQNEHLDALLN